MWHWILDLLLIFLLIMFTVDGLTFLWVRRIYNFLYHFKKWVILFDLDGFKVINDQQGHHVGDKVLRKVGLILLSGSRFAFRYGGDEFAILVFGSDKDKVMRLGKKITERINQKLKPFKVTVSFGIGRTEEEADREMYRMKGENKR